jgi:hypothetical protein
VELKTTKRKNCKTFYAKRESVMRLPKDTALNQRDWPRDSSSPSCCMLIDTNLTPKLWPYAAHYAVLVYNNLPHSALDNHKSPNNAFGDSSDFSKLYVFDSICYALQPSKLLHKLEERSAKGLFLGIDPAGYKVLDLESKVAFVAITVKVFDGKFLSTEENQIHGFCREEEPTQSISLDPTPARLEDEPQGFAAQSQTPWTTRVSLKDLPKRANLKLGWIQCEKSSQVS